MSKFHVAIFKTKGEDEFVSCHVAAADIPYQLRAVMEDNGELQIIPDDMDQKMIRCYCELLERVASEHDVQVRCVEDDDTADDECPFAGETVEADAYTSTRDGDDYAVAERMLQDVEDWINLIIEERGGALVDWTATVSCASDDVIWI